jgi:plasmid stabilization system protein ParE
VTWVLSFNKQARSEIREAAHHYGLESPTLRVAFLDAIDTALAELLEHPILAVMHQSRRPFYWLGRS